MSDALENFHPEEHVVETPSLKDAMRLKRDGSLVMIRAEALDEERASATTDLATTTKRRDTKGRWTKDTIVKPATPPEYQGVEWTAAEFRTYDRLTAMACSPTISERARAAAWLRRFEEKHGHLKCNAIMDAIRRRDAEAWFKDKNRLRGA